MFRQIKPSSGLFLA